MYNLVYGDGPGVGAALSSHPDIDMVSFTGSTRAGVDVAKNAAATVNKPTSSWVRRKPVIVIACHAEPISTDRPEAGRAKACDRPAAAGGCRAGTRCSKPNHLSPVQPAGGRRQFG